MSDSNSYSTGHPWYYVLGGKVLSLKEIWQEAEQANYKGYRETEIDKANGNNTKLRSLKAETIQRLKVDVSGYRTSALALHRYRKTLPKDWHPECDDIHTAMGLKRNHVFNEFANLQHIDELLAYQPDLFDFQ
jgi:hypothetical protein